MANKSDINYEANILFRLVKVSYWFFLIVGILTICISSFEEYRVQEPYMPKSAVPIKMTRYEYEDKFGTQPNTTPTALTPERRAQMDAVLRDSNNDDMAFTPKSFVPDQIQNKSIGSWWIVAGIWIFGNFAYYLILNLTRETFNYLFVGKPFDWLWLKNIKSKLVALR